MRASLKWLKTLVDMDLDTRELVDRLDMTGTAVEGVETMGEGLEHIVVGQIVAKDPHPDADKLWVTSVDVGDGTPRTIVCGAQNFEAGDKVPVALPGAVLPGGFAIKKAKLRGVTSEGMNCSARELGMGEDHAGLLILDANAPVGMPFARFAGMSDEIIDLEVTPNRPDCLSMLGVAREVAAVLDLPVRPVDFAVAEGGVAAAEQCAVRIDDASLCPRYAARVVRGVKVGPSPEWLAQRVMAAGARSINNVVDITNYVMFEMGQPLHAFDLDTLQSGADGRVQIVVRTAREGERLITLDGIERDLAADTLLICDPRGPVALAGVMGGEETEVSDATVNILLEAACFNPASISRTSRRLGLVSEASMRFERGVDRVSCVAALDRAASLLAELAGGEVSSGVVDEYPEPHVPVVLELRLARLAQIVGTGFEVGEVASTLTRLGCEVAAPVDRPDAGTMLSVTVPSFRPDLEREIDLVEEVLRIRGMSEIEATLPAGTGRAGGRSAEQTGREKIGQVLRAAGLSETMAYSFADPADAERLGMQLPADELPVELLNPMSGEQSVLRTTLLGGLLRSVGYNQRRGVADIHLYEMGGTYRTALGRKQPKERLRVAGVLAGMWDRPSWNDPGFELDFFDGKGVVETLADQLRVRRFKVRAAQLPWLQPGRSAEVLIGGDVTGWLGEIHPAVLERFGCTGPVVAFELDATALVRAAADALPLVEPPRHPAVEVDIALVVEESVSAQQAQQAISSAGGKLLESVRLFDVYRGTGVPEGSKSLAFSLTYRASDRTLTTEEVESAHSKLVRKVEAATGGALRS